MSKNKQAKSYVFCFFFFARWIASISRVGSFNEQRHEKKSSKSVFNSFEKRYLANGMRYYVHRLSMFMRTFRKQNLSYIDSKGICLVKYNRLSTRSDKEKCQSYIYLTFFSIFLSCHSFFQIKSKTKLCTHFQVWSPSLYDFPISMTWMTWWFVYPKVYL